MAPLDTSPKLTLREPAATVAVLPGQRQRLAIVSTRNKLCGIAAYTQALERHLADVFEITVFDLDQYLLRGRHPRVRALGDRHIDEICRALSGFDAVNLQLEFGTLGRSPGDICHRFARLVAAAPRLSVTFHSLKRPPIFPLADFCKSILTLRWRSAGDIARAFKRERKLSLGIAQIMRSAQRRKPVAAIVHNRRDFADASHLHGLKRVFHHPLSFLSSEDIEAARAGATRRRFPLIEHIEPDAKLIGAFGFINEYKGMITCIKALYHLPATFHLLIFGGIHPNEIPLNTPVHPYIAKLLDEAHVDSSLYEQVREKDGTGLNLDIEKHLDALFGAHPRDLSARLHFMGASSDDDFLAGMAICNAVVFPYLEVGQSASGPIAQAVELGCRVIASRTHTFMEFASYHPDTIEFFDIGNHLELAERIAARPQFSARVDARRYNVESNRAVYLAANTVPESLPRHRRQRLRALVGRRARR